MQRFLWVSKFKGLDVAKTPHENRICWRLYRRSKRQFATRCLKAAGCEKVVTHQVSGVSGKCLKLDKLLSGLQTGDVLTVWRMDRVGRSLTHLIEVVRNLDAKGAHFQSLTEGIDTTTAQGRMRFHLMGALAEFERLLIVERTQAGLKAARSRGVKVGRPPALTAAYINMRESWSMLVTVLHLSPYLWV